MSNRSEKIGELAAALAKAQAQIKAAKKDTKNDFLKSSYADLASVWDSCREALSANGLSITQLPQYNDGTVVVTCLLMHASGEWIESVLSAPLGEGKGLSDLQLIGKAITYLRRYTLMAMVGVAPEDDDGNTAEDTASQFSQREEAPRPDFAPKVLDEQLIAIRVAATVSDLDNLALKLNNTKWPRAADKNAARDAFNKRRAELLEAERAPCLACDLVGRHAKDCPNDPKNAPKPAGA